MGELSRGPEVVVIVCQRKHWNLSHRETWVQMPAQSFTVYFLAPVFFWKMELIIYEVFEKIVV